MSDIPMEMSDFPMEMMRQHIYLLKCKSTDGRDSPYDTVLNCLDILPIGSDIAICEVTEDTKNRYHQNDLENVERQLPAQEVREERHWPSMIRYLDVTILLVCHAILALRAFNGFELSPMETDPVIPNTRKGIAEVAYQLFGTLFHVLANGGFRSTVCFHVDYMRKKYLESTEQTMESNLPNVLRKLPRCCLYEARCKAYAFLKKHTRSCSYIVMIVPMVFVAFPPFLSWNYSSVIHMLALSLIAAVTDKRLSIHIADGETVTIIAFILCHLVVSILHGIVGHGEWIQLWMCSTSVFLAAMVAVRVGLQMWRHYTKPSAGPQAVCP